MKRKPIRYCTVSKCERIHTARGYCSSHYEQFKRGISDPKDFTPLPRRPKCLISGCDRPHYCKGGCRSHYDITLRFNLSLVQIIQIYAGGCGICLKDGDIHVDHDHSCCQGDRSCGNCIRGGLCGDCNMALGSLGDSEEGILRALNYVKQHGRLEREPKHEGDPWLTNQSRT